MADLSRTQLVLCALGAVVVVALGLGRLGGDASGTSPSPAAPAPAAMRIESASAERVLVHVAGAVRRPGVYRLRASARVDDAVRRAGGATRRGDLGGLNLAAKLEDGRQVLVPERAPKAAVSAGAGAGITAPATATAPATPVNLNTATLEQLDVLPGIGPAMAQRILDHRESNGGFGSVEELADVPGIAEGRMAALRDLVSV
jgi:competence protein ComEA